MATSQNKTSNETLGKINPSEGLRSQIGEIGEKAEHLSKDASEYANRFYETATQWLEENRTTAITTVAVFATLGIAAYFITRNMSASKLEKTDRAA